LTPLKGKEKEIKETKKHPTKSWSFFPKEMEFIISSGWLNILSMWQAEKVSKKN